MATDNKLWSERNAWLVGKWTGITMFIPFGFLTILSLTKSNFATGGEFLGSGIASALIFGGIAGLIALGVIKIRNKKVR